MSGQVVQNTGATMVDAQMTSVRVVKPFNGFESVYQGKPTSTPIAFPGTKDPRAAAGQAGFDPNLLEGIAVPQGSRVLLNFPLTPAPGEEGGFTSYTYRIVERFTNLNDYRNPPAGKPRPAFHFTKSSPGAPDTTGGTLKPRTLRPAFWRDIGFEAPLAFASNGQLRLRPEEIIVDEASLLNLGRPLLPDGTSGVLQQGVLDPETNPIAAGIPLFLPFWFDAEGDEIIILATRTDLASPTLEWDFESAEADLPFSNIYGDANGTHPNFPDLGIYVQTGTTP